MSEECRWCRYWGIKPHNRVDILGQRPCLRYPPVGYPHSLGGPDQVWPMMRPEDWCGEFVGVEVAADSLVKTPGMEEGRL